MTDALFQKAREEFDRDGFTVIKGFLAGEQKHELLKTRESRYGAPRGVQ